MKNSKEYSQKVQKHFRSLRRRYKKPQKPEYEEPINAMVYGVLLENLSEKDAAEAFEKIHEHYIDLNELRVSRTQETVEVLKHLDKKIAQNTATELNRSLQTVFRKYNFLSLKPIQKDGIRSARSMMEDREGISHFVANYITLTTLDGHALPLNETMIEYLRENELVHPDADPDDIEGFLARQILADDIYEFYVLLRRASESSQRGMRKGKNARTKNRKKAKKSKKTKKTKKTKKSTKKKKTKKKKTTSKKK